MRTLSHLFASNRAWSQRIREQDPEFFLKLSRQQTPRYLWIGAPTAACRRTKSWAAAVSYSSTATWLIVAHTDLNCLSVAQFAVDILRSNTSSSAVTTAAVACAPCFARNGWAGGQLAPPCGGRAAEAPGPLVALPELAQRLDRLCEFNVIEQVLNLCHTSIVRDAWQRAKPWRCTLIYGLQDGLLRDLTRP